MSWLLVVVAIWVSVAVPLALTVGCMVRLADRRDAALSRSTVPDFVPPQWTMSTADNG